MAAAAVAAASGRRRRRRAAASKQGRKPTGLVCVVYLILLYTYTNRIYVADTTIGFKHGGVYYYYYSYEIIYSVSGETVARGATFPRARERRPLGWILRRARGRGKKKKKYARARTSRVYARPAFQYASDVRR